MTDTSRSGVAEDGLDRDELQRAIYELHDHQGLRFAQIATCLPLDLAEVCALYEDHTPVVTDGGEPDVFLTDQIGAIYEGEEIVIWNSVTVRQHHDVGVGSIRSEHSILASDGSTGEKPEYITPAIDEQLRNLDVYPEPTVIDPRDEEVTIL